MLTHLSFRQEFNPPPPSTPNNSPLSFGDCFNQPAHHLPLFTTNLTMGEYFNQPLSIVEFRLGHSLITLLHFPSSITSLSAPSMPIYN